MMKRDIVDIVMEKEFIELTQNERVELKEFCTSEEEYNQLKNVFTSVEGMTFDTPEPKAETKDRLDQLFDETYPKASPVWYSSVLAVLVPKEKPLHRQPLMQIAAVALLLLLVVPFFGTDMTANDNLMADNDVVTTESVEEKEDASMLQEHEEAADDEILMENMDAGGNTSGVASLAAVEPELTPTSTFASSPAPSSNHPDGIFMGGAGSDESIAYSQPASESSDLLDLLTTAF